MKFIVSKKRVSVTENRKPCDESVEEELTPLDYRTVKTLEEAKGKIWYKDWFEGGENHREEDMKTSTSIATVALIASATLFSSAALAKPQLRFSSTRQS